MGNVPKPPVKRSHVHKAAGHGPDGPRAGHIVGTCHHTMEGTLRGTDNFFHDPNIGALTDYGIGGIWDDVLDGVIYEWIAPESEIVPHANGRVGEATAPHGDGPAFIAQFATPEINAVNRRLRSIETSDGGNSSVSKGGREIESLCFLTAWIHAEQAGQTADTFAWNMHHREFGVAHQQCPGAWIIHNVVAIQDRTKAIMRAYQEEIPLDPPLRISYPPGWTGGFIPQPGQDGPLFSEFAATRSFQTVDNAVGRQDPVTSSPMLRQFQDGETIDCDGVYTGQFVGNDDQWVRTMGPQPMVVHSSGLKQAI
jgi:hypothetical protein